MNTLIAIIGLGVLCLLFEILNLKYTTITFAILGLDISEFNSCRLLQQYDYCQ
jgi:NADH-quinone oxidoreductase subunit N